MASVLNPYISFDGDARQAMEFYKGVFGGTLTSNTFGEYGAADGPAADQIMHSQLVTDAGITLMAADTPPHATHTYGDNIAVSLSGTDADELRGYWEKLSAAGKVSVPLEKQMWGDEFGMCTDQFGINWMVNITPADLIRRAPVGSRSVSQQRVSYAGAGVDIEAGDRAVELMKAWVAKASRPEVVGGIGGFAGLFDASALKAYRRPLLATSTDGVGTKVAVAAAADRHDTIGHDLVGMVVDDLVVCGAEPLFMTDYIACGKVVPERIAAVVKGIAEGCVLAGCALVGGETAEHPGLLGPDEYDVAGAGTGVVEADRLLGADRVRAGDVLVAMASSGLHSNGYSLVRHVLLGESGAGWELDREAPELGRSLVDELLEPTRIYARDCLALIDAVEVRAFSHITGGGLAANLARVLPADLGATVDRATWSPAPVFGLVRDVGGVAVEEVERTLNMGVGMVAVVAADEADRTVELLTGRGVPAWVLGTVGKGDGTVAVQGSHPA